MILGIPFSKGGLGKTSGTEQAPDAVAKHLAPYLSELGLTTNAPYELFDLDQSVIESAMDQITKRVSDLPDGSVIIGGDHTITYATLRAFAKTHPGFGLVVFDAHLDMMQPFNVPTHENYLRQAIHDGIIDKEQIIVIGHRVADPEEQTYAKTNHIITYPMHEVTREGLHQTCDAVMAAIRDWPHVYLSIDIDALDPAFAPGTGYGEPGGLSTRELLYFIQRLVLLGNIRMADVVEINPLKDTDERTCIVGAKLVKELHSSLNGNNKI